MARVIKEAASFPPPDRAIWPGAARHAPAAARNRAPLLEALRGWLDADARVLEVASGTGEHAVFCAAAEPGWLWMPSDVNPDALGSIEAHRIRAGLPNVAAARQLDVRQDWHGQEVDVASVDVVLSINMIHISPWAAARGLFRGAARVLASSGRLILYGPFRFSGSFTAPSNEAFDQSLRQRDATHGVRDLDDLTELSRSFGLRKVECAPLPANNHLLVFERSRG